jgi:anti-sigma factor RsiW
VTSTTDTTGHPDVAEISDLTEGLLPPSRTAEVRRHLDECELCADVHDSLEEIRGLLGTMPGPPRMPAEIASRIDAALAAEALLGATAPETLAAPTLVSASRVTSDEDRKVGENTGAHVSRETSPTADRPSGRAHAATGPGRKDRKEGKERNRGSRRGRIVLGAVFTAAVLGAGSLFIQSLGDHKSSDTLKGTRRVPRTPSPRGSWRVRSRRSSPPSRPRFRAPAVSRPGTPRSTPAGRSLPPRLLKS